MNTNRCVDCGTPIGSRSQRCMPCSNTKIARAKKPAKFCPKCGVQVTQKEVNCKGCRRRYRRAADAGTIEPTDVRHAAEVERQMQAIVDRELLMPWERVG